MKTICVHGYDALANPDKKPFMIDYTVYNVINGKFDFIGSTRKFVDTESITHACILGVSGAVNKFAHEKFFGGVVVIGEKDAYHYIDGYLYTQDKGISKLIDDIHYWALKMQLILKYGHNAEVALCLDIERLKTEQADKEYNTWTRFK